MNKNKYIYVMISATSTRVGYLIRKVGRISYNHCAIALNPDLDPLYAFARRQHKAVLTGGLVTESIERYTLKKNDDVPVVIFKIPVTKEQHEWISLKIECIHNDPEFIYNLFSMISYPLIKGFSIYKAFTCIEFITFILRYLDFPISAPIYTYKPDDLLELLGDYQYFKGNLLEYKKADTIQDATYFAPMSWHIMKENTLSLTKICSRTFLHATKNDHYLHK